MRRLTTLWRHRISRHAAVIFLGSLAAFALTAASALNLYDEGITLMGAERVSHGQIPHRDFYTLYGPGYFSLIAALFDLFGHSVLVERACDVLFRAANVTLVFLIVARAGSLAAAWIAAMVSLVVLGAILTPGYVMIPALCFTLGSLACLWPMLDNAAGPRPGFRLFAAGLCTGGVLLFRYDVGGALLVAQSVCLGAQASLSASPAHAPVMMRLRFAVGRVSPYLFGVLVPVLPWAVAVVVGGATGDLLFQIFVLPARTYAPMRSLPLPGLHMLWRHPSISIVYVPVFVFLMTVLFLAADKARRTPAASLPWTIIMVTATMLVFVGKAYVRISPAHMQAAIVTGLALMGIWWPRTRGWQRPVFALAASAAGTCALLWLQPELQEMRAGYAWWRASGPCATVDIPRLSCLPFDAPHLAAIRLIRRSTDPAKPVFAGAGRHDKIFVNDMVLPFLADRPSATKWQQMDPGLQTTAPIQRQIVAELARLCPSYAVLETQWDDVREPNNSSVSSGVTVLDDALRQGFREVARFGTVGVYANASSCAAAAGIPAHPGPRESLFAPDGINGANNRP